MKSLFVGLILACLTGCASLGLATPKGFDQQLAEAYGVHTAVVNATATALTAGSINVTEAELVQTQEAAARRLLDAARSIEATNPSGASNDLVLASAALTAIQTYLSSRSK